MLIFTGKNVKISSKGFAIPTEKSNAKQITKGNAIPTGSKSAINCTKMSNKSIKQKNAKIKRCENAKSIGKRVPMGPKIGSIIQLPARPFGRPTATPSPSTRPSRNPTKNVTGSLTKPVMTYLTRIVIGSTERNVKMLPIKTAMMCHGKIVNKSTSRYLIKLPGGDPIGNVQFFVFLHLLIFAFFCLKLLLDIFVQLIALLLSICIVLTFEICLALLFSVQIANPLKLILTFASLKINKNQN